MMHKSVCRLHGKQAVIHTHCSLDADEILSNSFHLMSSDVQHDDNVLLVAQSEEQRSLSDKSTAGSYKVFSCYLGKRNA